MNSVFIMIQTVENRETGEPGDELTGSAKEWCQSIGSKATSLSEILETPDQQVDDVTYKLVYYMSADVCISLQSSIDMSTH